MPSRNIVREYVPEAYYHVYNRGVEKRLIFLDEQDYRVFIGLLKKYLIGSTPPEYHRHKFNTYENNLELLAFCLMPNHFHLLFYQYDKSAIIEFMRRLSTGYVMYFNNRYNRVGSLFQGTYKASSINADSYLHHVSRYIHLNPKDYDKWPYSSLAYYKGERKAKWLRPEKVLDLFNNDRSEYLAFVSDYESSSAELALLKWQLANDV